MDPFCLPQTIAGPARIVPGGGGWDPGWVLRFDPSPVWQRQPLPTTSPPLRDRGPSSQLAAGCARGGGKDKKLWRFLRNANTGAFRLECHRGLEPTAKYSFVPNICVLQPSVFSLGAAHPGKGQAHGMTVSCELCFNELCCWLAWDVQDGRVPALCFDHPLALALLGGTGNFWDSRMLVAYRVFPLTAAATWIILAKDALRRAATSPAGTFFPEHCPTVRDKTISECRARPRSPSTPTWTKQTPSLHKAASRSGSAEAGDAQPELSQYGSLTPPVCLLLTGRPF